MRIKIQKDSNAKQAKQNDLLIGIKFSEAKNCLLLNAIIIIIFFFQIVLTFEYNFNK